MPRPRRTGQRSAPRSHGPVEPRPRGRSIRAARPRPHFARATAAPVQRRPVRRQRCRPPSSRGRPSRPGPRGRRARCMRRPRVRLAASRPAQRRERRPRELLDADAPVALQGDHGWVSGHGDLLRGSWGSGCAPATVGRLPADARTSCDGDLLGEAARWSVAGEQVERVADAELEDLESARRSAAQSRRDLHRGTAFRHI